LCYVDVGGAASVIHEKVMKEPTSPTERMEQYRFTPEDEAMLVSFRPVLQNVDLDTVNRKAAELASYATKFGVYCWVMRWREARYKIYVGRTKSLPRRLKEYGNPFQPGVPNDYKLRHFQKWMRAEFEGAQLDLYFVESGDHNALETTIVRKLNPFINERMHGDKDAFIAASWLFYRDSFERRLANRQSRMKAEKPAGVRAVPKIGRSTKGPSPNSEIARAREKFAELGFFKSGTNRDAIYQLLTRDGGAAEDEFRLACRNPHRASSIISDVRDVATIADRELLSVIRDGVKCYTLGGPRANS
jgi:hypothetical protein